MQSYARLLVKRSGIYAYQGQSWAASYLPIMSLAGSYGRPPVIRHLVGHSTLRIMIQILFFSWILPDALPTVQVCGQKGAECWKPLFLHHPNLIITLSSWLFTPLDYSIIQPLKQHCECLATKLPNLVLSLLTSFALDWLHFVGYGQTFLLSDKTEAIRNYSLILRSHRQ